MKNNCRAFIKIHQYITRIILMKRFTFKLVLFLLVSFILSSCTQRILDFTLISSKNIDLTRGASFTREKTRKEGIDKVHWIISIPTGVVNIKEALDRAIESTPGCVALLDGVIYSKFWWIGIYGQQSVIVEGTPLIDPNLATNQEQIPNYGKIELNYKGEIKAMETLSSSQFLVLKNKIVKHKQSVRFSNSTEIQ